MFNFPVFKTRFFWPKAQAGRLAQTFTRVGGVVCCLFFLVMLTGCAEEEVVKKEEAEEPAVTYPMGVELGDFYIQQSLSGQDKKSTIAFQVYLSTTKEKHKNLIAYVTHQRNNIRDQILVSTRSLSPKQLGQQDLSYLRRRILVRLNRIIPQLPLENVYITNYEYKVE